jgi:hypothetical protein
MQIDTIRIQENSGYGLLAGGAAGAVVTHMRGKHWAQTHTAAAIGGIGFALADAARTERGADGLESAAKDRINEGVNELLPPGSANRDRASTALVGGGLALAGAAWLFLNPKRPVGFSKYLAEQLTKTPADYSTLIKHERRAVTLAGATATSIGLGLASDKGIVDGTIEEIENQRNPIGVGT